MAEHLPECMTSVVRMNYDCICPELRACEQRVLNAAEAAVARAQDGLTYQVVKNASDGITERNRVYTMLALHRDRTFAAIRALKEKP